MGKVFRAKHASMRRIAVAGAALILFVQLLGAIHWHPANFDNAASASAALSVDNGLCAVCLLAFHSSLNPATVPTLAHPLRELAMAPVAGCAGFSAFDPASHLSRAPPVSL
jgi:hypothetical protein